MVTMSHPYKIPCNGITPVYLTNNRVKSNHLLKVTFANEEVFAEADASGQRVRSCLYSEVSGVEGQSLAMCQQ